MYLLISYLLVEIPILFKDTLFFVKKKVFCEKDLGMISEYWCFGKKRGILWGMIGLCRECKFNRNIEDFDIYTSLEYFADSGLNLESVVKQLESEGIVLIWARDGDPYLSALLEGPWDIEDFDIGDGLLQVIYDENFFERRELFEYIDLNLDVRFLVSFNDDSVVAFIKKDEDMI